MADSLILTLMVGSVLGFLAGLGVGGGSLLLLWLTLIVQLEPPEARIINLLFFLPSAVITCLFRWKQGTLVIKNILPAIIGGCGGAVLGSFAADYLPVSILRKLFGMLLLATGIREILYKQKKQAS